MSTLASPLDRLRELGGSVYLDGEKLRYRIPATDEGRRLAGEIRANREAIREMLRERESKPPTLEEVMASLPPGVRVVRYEPKESPFAVAPVCVVINAGRFYRAYLAALGWRLAKPEGYHCAPLADILGKLADAGLELALLRKSANRIPE
jgi:hypothetical protein